MSPSLPRGRYSFIRTCALACFVLGIIKSFRSTTLSSASTMSDFTVPSCDYTEDAITSNYTYQTTLVKDNVVQPIETALKMETQRKVPKLGVMLVGMGGNNGSTCIAGAVANRLGITWETKDGVKQSNYWGSLFLASTCPLGNDEKGNSVHIPLNKLLPMTHPNDIVWGGWDISSLDMAQAMKRAKVLDVQLQNQLEPHLKGMKPLPSVYFPDFIAANQGERADNVLKGTKQELLTQLRKDISDFKAYNELDKVIVLWTANTERFTQIEEGLHDTSENLLKAIQRGEEEISASTLFAVASILEGSAFINGSPQNTLIPGVVDLATQNGVFVAGDDFKSGQTKMKSVLVDFLVTAGIKPVSIVSYNHLGNNDGYNLSAPAQFRSKEISKSNVVDDMVASNSILYDKEEHPDHVVVIKYVPYVADSKRAMDEYTNEIFMGGTNTIVLHNTCEDSLLATPLIYDLVLLTELCQRIRINGESLHSVLSLLSFMLKAPVVPDGAPVVNALFGQRQAIVNFMRACLGLPADNYLTLEHRLPSLMKQKVATKLVNGHSVGNGVINGTGNKKARLE